jgi:hypothetical protein
VPVDLDGAVDGKSPPRRSDHTVSALASKSSNNNSNSAARWSDEVFMPQG